MVVDILDYNRCCLVKINNVPDISQEELEEILFTNYNEDEIYYMCHKEEIPEVERDFNDLIQLYHGSEE